MSLDAIVMHNTCNILFSIDKKQTTLSFFVHGHACTSHTLTSNAFHKFSKP
ncbi:hypothetical protein LguiA_023090 [Lonicera macranthoides]